MARRVPVSLLAWAAVVSSGLAESEYWACACYQDRKPRELVETFVEAAEAVAVYCTDPLDCRAESFDWDRDTAVEAG